MGRFLVDASVKRNIAIADGSLCRDVWSKSASLNRVRVDAVETIVVKEMWNLN
jgi:hypothetical protein